MTSGPNEHQPAQAWPGEQAFDDDDALDEDQQLHPDVGKQRNAGVPEHVAEENQPAAQALRCGEPDVLRLPESFIPLHWSLYLSY